MSFSIEKVGTTVVIDLAGHLVVGNRQALKQLVLEQLARGERCFQVDFARTRYVDSSGLGVLVAMSKQVASEHGTFSLANLDADLKTLFVLTKLDTLFHFVERSTPADVQAPPVVAPADPLRPASRDEHTAKGPPRTGAAPS